MAAMALARDEGLRRASQVNGANASSSQDASKSGSIQQQPTSSPYEDLQRDWDKFMADCKGMAGPNWSEFSKEPKPDDERDRVLEKISTKDAKGRARRESAKAMFKNTLLCISNIGSIVSSGASTVYPASSQVYNALTFVIEAIQGYWRIFDDFTAMTREVTAFLAQVAVYLKDDLQSLIQREEEKFILAIFKEFTRSLASMHALATSWKVKIKTFSKIMLLKKDNGIADSLVEIEKLVKDFTGVRGAIVRAEVHANLYKVQIIAADVLEIKGKVSDLHRDNRRMRRLQAAHDRLQIGDLDEIQREFHNLLSDQAVEGTGEWTWHDKGHGFPYWFDVKTPVKQCKSDHDEDKSDPHNQKYNPIISLEAPSGHGKTYLSNRIVQHLRSTYPAQTDGSQGSGSVFIAKFYFNQSALDIAAINRGLRSIIWQLVQHHPGYLDYFETVNREQGITMHDTLKLWRTMILRAMAEPCKDYLYIVLDGMNSFEGNADTVTARILLELECEANQRQPIRVFITGQKQGVEGLESAMRSMRTVDLALNSSIKPGLPKQLERLRNTEDLRKFIQWGLREIFTGESFHEQAETRKYIERKIMAYKSGSFADLQQVLQRISAACEMDAVERAIEEILYTKKRKSARAAKSQQIQDLQDKLEDSTIRELNFIIGTMLIWPQPVQLRAKMIALDETKVETWVPLEVITGLVPLRGEGRVVGSINHRINVTYSAIIQLDQRAERGMVTMTNGMKRLLKSRMAWASPTSAEQTDSGRSCEALEDTEHSETFSTRPSIGFDFLHSILQLLESCLASVTGAADVQQYNLLRSETYVNLEDFLATACRAFVNTSKDNGLRKPNIDTVLQITGRIVKFFRDNECISAYWHHLRTVEANTTYNTYDMSSLWGISSSAWEWLKAVRGALQDSVATDADERTFIVGIVDAQNLSLLLEPMAKWVAHRWLRGLSASERVSNGENHSLDGDEMACWATRDHDKCFVWLLKYSSESASEQESDLIYTWMGSRRSRSSAFDNFYASLDMRKRRNTEQNRSLTQVLLSGGSVGHAALPGCVGSCVVKLLYLESSDPELQTRLGETCFRHGYYDAAARYFRTALSSDSEHFGRRVCLADALRKENRTSEALDILLPLTDKVLPSPEGSDANGHKIGQQQIRRRIMWCQFLMADTENGIVSAQKVFEHCMQDCSNIRDAAFDAPYYIVMLAAQQKWNEIIDVVERLNKDEILETSLAAFARVAELHDALRTAGVETGQLDWLISAYNSAEENCVPSSEEDHLDDSDKDKWNLASWLRYYQAELRQAAGKVVEANAMWRGLQDNARLIVERGDDVGISGIRPDSPVLLDAVTERLSVGQPIDVVQMHD